DDRVELGASGLEVRVILELGANIGDSAEPLSRLRELEGRIVGHEVAEAVPVLATQDVGKTAQQALVDWVRHGFVPATGSELAAARATALGSGCIARSSVSVKARERNVASARSWAPTKVPRAARRISAGRSSRDA